MYSYDVTVWRTYQGIIKIYFLIIDFNYKKNYTMLNGKVRNEFWKIITVPKLSFPDFVSRVKLQL